MPCAFLCPLPPSFAFPLRWIHLSLSAFGPRLYSFRSISRPWSPASNPRLPAMSCFTSAAAIGLIISAKKPFAPYSGFIPPSFGSSRASVWLASRSSISRSSGSPTRASPTSKPCLSSPMPAHRSQPFQPRPFSPNAGIAGGVSGGVKSGVSGGVAAGVEGGISGDAAKGSSVDEPNVDISTIWTDTVKRGSMMRQVRGLGTLVRADGSTKLVARVTLPASMVVDVKPGQDALVETQEGPFAKGHVSSISPSASGDTRIVNVVLDAVSEGTSAGLKVDATINIERLENVLYIGRPVNGRQNSEISLFKITDNGAEAVLTQVQLGLSSVNSPYATVALQL